MAAWDEAFDLVAVGSGIGGCAAATAGARSGLKVLVLEKTGRVGGTTAWSQGLLWVGNNHLARERGVVDSAEETRTYLDWMADGRNDPVVTSSYVEQAPEAVRFFEQAGIPFYPPEGLPDHYYPLAAGGKPWGRSLHVRPLDARTLGEWQERLEFTPYGHGRITFEEMVRWGGRAGYRNWDHKVLAEREASDTRAGGAAVAGHFFKAALDSGAEIRTQAEATRLIVEEGGVSGVEVRSSGETRRIQARRGVVLAAGNYAANQRLAGWLDEWVPQAPNFAPRNQGDGFILAAEHGAAFTVMHGNLAILMSFHVPGESVDGQPLSRIAGAREVAYPHSILVNRAGQRFADESAFGDVGTRVRHFDFATHRMVNMPCYLIFDRQYLAKYGLGPLPPNCDPPGWLPRGDTPAELAAKVGIDPRALEATLERFNGFASEGRDPEFLRGRMHWSATTAGDSTQKNPNLGTVSEPPFFALETTPNVSAVGLVINAHGQVVHLRGHAIAGLYACGDVVAPSLWYGVGYQAGLSLGPAMTFGWLAARHAAGKASST